MLSLKHTARQYADALAALLPVGAAWQWDTGSFGDNLLLMTAQELARLDAATQLVLDEAIELHRPAKSSYTLIDYQRVADEATRIVLRKPAAIGCHINYRLWSHDAPPAVFPSPVVLLVLAYPAKVGSHIGDSLWSSRCRYYLRIQLDRSLINTPVLFAALRAFKQAHVFLYVEDIADMAYVDTYDNPHLNWDDVNLIWN